MSQNILKSINVEEDYYSILEVARDADQGTIKKAYYKLSLQLHPDKNPDDPKAKDLYHKVKLAYALLTDIEAKANYDAVLKQKEIKTIRLQSLNEKKRKMREELNAREETADQLKRKKEDFVVLNRCAEVERVRYENELRLRQLEQEMKHRINLVHSLSESFTIEKNTPKELSTSLLVQCRWKLKKKQFNEHDLTQLFSTFGPIDTFILREMKKKYGIAMVQFQQPSSIQNVMHAVKNKEFKKEDAPLFEYLDISFIPSEPTSASNSSLSSNSSIPSTEKKEPSHLSSSSSLLFELKETDILAQMKQYHNRP